MGYRKKVHTKNVTECRGIQNKIIAGYTGLRISWGQTKLIIF